MVGRESVEDTEVALLSCIFNDPNKLLTELSQFIPTSEYFTTPSARRIYETLIELDKSDVKPSKFQVKKILREDAEPTISMLESSVGIEANLKYYARELRKFYQVRMLSEIGQSLVKISPNDLNNALKLSGSIESVFAEGSHDLMSIQDVLADTWELFLTSEYSKEFLFKTGFKYIDSILQGVPKGALIILAARPGVGKTAFALELLERFSKQTSVAFFSLEMTREELGLRMFSAATKIPQAKIKFGKLTEAEQAKIADYISAKDSNKVYINDQSDMILSIFENQIKTLKVKDPNLGIVILDYLQLLATGSKSRYEEISDISREMKKIAGKYDVALIALAQLSRASEQRANKMPMLSDLRDSGAIEQDANQVWLLHRDQYEGELPDVLDMKFIIAKNRSGGVGIADLVFTRSQTRFWEPQRA
ncbi:MAG: AAA family ATPase [Candidatus Caenarcaniphilales bacterium]|nr:AAA family ATPase [Candidatus Caenarcaniphilales bacterium]